MRGVNTIFVSPSMIPINDPYKRLGAGGEGVVLGISIINTEAPMFLTFEDFEETMVETEFEIRI